MTAWLTPAMLDERAERSVLGGCMLSTTAVWDAIEACRPSDFHDPRYEAIFQAITDLAGESKPVDVVTVGDHLQRGRVQIPPMLLHELTTEVPTAANAGYYAEIVAGKSKHRKVAATLASLQDSTAAPDDVEAMLAHALEALEEVSLSVADVSAPIGSLWDQMVEGLASKPTFEPTPWPELDRLLGGFRPGALYTVAARPAVGKSVIALQIAQRLATHGPVAFVSLEMPREEVMNRLLASTGAVRLQTLVDHQMRDRDWAGLASQRAYVEGLPLFVSDDVTSPLQVASEARGLHRKGGLKAVVVDYLQLLEADERRESQQVELSVMTRGFKRLAQRLGVPVILLSQLNRAGAHRGRDARPLLTDLRGSGSIEQDSDCVLLLHRDEGGHELEVSVAKNRHGETGDFVLSWEGQYARAVPRPWSPTALLG